VKAKLRAQIKKRDQGRCRYCGTDRGPLTIDHIVPTSRGGHPEKKANLVTACFPCNQKKANKTPEEAGMVILTEGFEYTPPGRVNDDLRAVSEMAVVHHGRKQRRKRKRKERKALVKAIMRDGVEAHLCSCGVGFHTKYSCPFEEGAQK
jgi:hypothetical protein